MLPAPTMAGMGRGGGGCPQESACTAGSREIQCFELPLAHALTCQYPAPMHI